MIYLISALCITFNLAQVLRPIKNVKYSVTLTVKNPRKKPSQNELSRENPSGEGLLWRKPLTLFWGLWRKPLTLFSGLWRKPLNFIKSTHFGNLEY